MTAGFKILKMDDFLERMLIMWTFLKIFFLRYNYHVANRFRSYTPQSFQFNGACGGVLFVLFLFS